jgi:hypothetical protein
MMPRLPSKLFGFVFMVFFVPLCGKEMSRPNFFGVWVGYAHGFEVG